MNEDLDNKRNPSESENGSDELNGNTSDHKETGDKPVNTDFTCSCKSRGKSAQRKRTDEQVGSSGSKRSTLKTMPFGSGKRSRGKALRTKDGIGNNVKKKNNWVLKFNCAKLKSGLSCPSSSFVETDLPESSVVCDSCICTGYRTTEEHHLGAGVVFESEPPAEHTSKALVKKGSCPLKNETRNNQIIDLSKLYSDDVTIEDNDKKAKLERAREIIEGIDPPPGFQPGQRIQLVCPTDLTLDNLTMLVQTHLGLQNGSLSGVSQIDVSLSPSAHRMVHTQVDYVHCLVPDLLQITACSFYWGNFFQFT